MARESSLNVSLTPTLRNYIRAKVRSGRYESASEVIRESLRALQERERVAGEFWQGVRSKVAVARAQAEQGQTVDGEAAMEEILAELEPRQKRSRKPKAPRSAR